MSIEVTSTTDTEQAVVAAQGDQQTEKVEEVSKKEVAETSTDASSNKGDESEDSQELSSGDTEEHDSESEESEEKPKKKSGYKNRVKRLANKLTAQEKETEFWRAEALKAKQNSSQEMEQEKAPPVAESKPDPDDFEEHSDYVEALTDWKLEQKLRDRDVRTKEERLRENHQTKVSTFQEQVEGFKENHPDFDEAMESVNDIPMSSTVQEVVLESKVGPELMYGLAKNSEEYERICKLSPLEAAKALGRFEEKISKLNGGGEKAQTTKAPKPIEPVGSKSSGSGAKSLDDPDISQKEFERLREKQIHDRRGA